jgi:hypothetical protein
LRQQDLPADIVELWDAFTALSADARRRFLQAGNLYRQAISLGRDDKTLGFTLLVVACEALKPPGARYDGHNSPAVVNALLGEDCAKHLLAKGVHALAVRNGLLHRGEFKGGEYTQLLFMPSNQDPTFDERRRVLGVITPAAIIEWLRRGGVYTLPPRRFEQRHTWGWGKTAAILGGVASLLAGGAVFGWALRSFIGR